MKPTHPDLRCKYQTTSAHVLHTRRQNRLSVPFPHLNSMRVGLPYLVHLAAVPRRALSLVLFITSNDPGEHKWQ